MRDDSGDWPSRRGTNGSAFVAGLIALLVSNFEARYAIVSEANTARGLRAGPAAYACAIATAALFWTSSYYGFKI